MEIRREIPHFGSLSILFSGTQSINPRTIGRTGKRKERQLCMRSVASIAECAGRGLKKSRARGRGVKVAVHRQLLSSRISSIRDSFQGRWKVPPRICRLQENFYRAKGSSA